MRRRKPALVLAASVIGLLAVMSPASAETIAQALASAYAGNPEINSARAQTRADDEGVPIARSGRLPEVMVTSTVTVQRIDPAQPGSDATTGAADIGLTVSLPVFSGFRVTNAIRESKAIVLTSRELLRNTVQNVLFDAAQAYADVLQNIAILNFRRRNVLFLDAQVRSTHDRFNIGESTITDVAQARAAAAQARAAVSFAEANLEISRAVYRQVVGHEPSGLSDAFPYRGLVPRQLATAIAVGENSHPVVLAAIHQAAAEGFAVKQIEGELLPTVSLEASITHDESFNTDQDPNTASIFGRVSIPLFPGGSVYPRIRQAKERYGMRRIEIDIARDQVRAAVASAWAQLDAAVASIAAAEEGIQAAELALSGVQEEQDVGQRTTLDVLDAQQVLLNARETLIVAQRDRLVASFSVLSAMGRLSAEALSLPTDAYDPTEHFDAVRGRLVGSSPPDGR